MNRRIALIAAVAVVGLSGCATVTRGTSETFIVTTEPAGATVRLSTGETCTTPCAVEKRRKHGFDVEIEREGYEPVATRVLPQVSGAGATGMAGNVLIGGVVGLIVDASTGAAKDLSPNPLAVTLVALPSGDVEVEVDDSVIVSSADGEEVSSEDEAQRVRTVGTHGS